MTTYIKLIKEQFEAHGFTIKALIITILSMILPFLFPFLGITILVIIDFWTSYKANKAEGISLYSEGLRRSIKKWTEYFFTIVVCIIVDAIITNAIDSYWKYFFTHIAVVIIAITELKSISENFEGASLVKVLKVISRYTIHKVSKDKKELAEILKEELNLTKEKKQRQLDSLKNQKKDKNKFNGD